MNKDYILTIDQGTTGSTVLIVALQNAQQPEVIGRANKEFQQHYPQSDWVEHNLEEIWDSIESAAQLAITRAQQNDPDFERSKIRACGITNQRETICIYERKTLRPLANAIVWQCKRSLNICAQLKKEGVEQSIREKTGLLLDPYFSGSKITWLLQNNPTIKKSLSDGTAIIGTIDTYLISRLTGGASHTTEVSNASRTMLFNIHSKKWDDELCDLFQIPNKSSLPEIKNSADEFGKSRGVSFLEDEVPITGVLGDQQAALFGQGCFEVGSAKCTYGTGSFLLMNSGSNISYSKANLLTTLAWQINGEATYAIEGSNFVAGAAIQFLRDNLQFFPDAQQTQDLARKAKAAPDIYFVPALSGLGAPYWQPNVKGAFFGLTRSTEKNQLIRAALEGIAFQVGELLKSMSQDNRSSLKKLRVDGGAAANELLCQIQADLSQVPVERPANLETTAYGAALIAALGVGYFQHISELAKAVEIEKEFTPAENTEEMNNHWAGWQRAIKALQVFHEY